PRVFLHPPSPPPPSFPYTTLFRSKALVERDVERDGDAVARRDRPALLAVALDDDLVRGQVVTRRPKASPRELLECSSLERLANRDRKSTRLNSSHGSISYAVFCLK